jgi:NHL repeat
MARTRAVLAFILLPASLASCGALGAVDASGNVYVGDENNNAIRKVDPLGVVSTLIGQGPNNLGFVDGDAGTALLYYPFGLTPDGSGSLYIADLGNAAIRKLDSQGLLTTLAGAGGSGWVDGPVAEAGFDSPIGVALDQAGNIYVVDETESAIRLIDPLGMVTTLAGQSTFDPGRAQEGFANGGPAMASFMDPAGIAINSAGILFVADTSNQAIRKVVP